MASVMNVRESKGFCDEAYAQLSDMKKKIIEIRDRSGGERSKEMGGMFGRHLTELADEIDWKIQILAHSCAYDWQGSADYENDVQVSAEEKTADKEFSPGYLGG